MLYLIILLKNKNEKFIIHSISNRVDDHFLFTKINFPKHETKRPVNQYQVENDETGRP